MKILLMNIPSGPYATDYPPVAISRVIEGIDPSISCDVSFIDIDITRPAIDKLFASIAEYKPDIIGFSAILTPGYAYLKELSINIKRHFPSIVQILGGEMAVISNIILLKTKIDFCVAGESEPTFSRLILRLRENNFKVDVKDSFKDIKGLVFLEKNTPFFTGYEDESRSLIRQVNYELLLRGADPVRYIHAVNGQYYRTRMSEHDRKNFFSLFLNENIAKNILTVFASKGCTNKCTFCHRFFKGYRVLDALGVIDYISRMKDTYSIGLVQFADENFGANEKETDKIISYLQKNRINWAAGAVRAKTVNEDIIKRWKNSGCVHVNFGIESCSQRMLDVMEKHTTVSDNLRALQLCNTLKIATIIGLVIGMPGETVETIEETIENLSRVIPDDIHLPYEICINFFQAVPGTPGYEFARNIGLIGASLDAEEEYIKSIYDANANDLTYYLNFTDYEKEELEFWKEYILFELMARYTKKHGIAKVLLNKYSKRFLLASLYGCFPRSLRKRALKCSIIIKKFGFIGFLNFFHREIFCRRQQSFSLLNRSVREIVEKQFVCARADEVNTFILRNGR